MNEYYELNNHKYNGNSNGCINGGGVVGSGVSGGLVGNGITGVNGNSNGSSIGSSFCGNAIGVRSNGIIMNGNGNHIKLNGLNGTGASRDRYQHPALKALINEAQSITCRGKCGTHKFYVCICSGIYLHSTHTQTNKLANYLRHKIL
jgi:hypothetical protein